MEYKVCIPAAGKGTRMGAFTNVLNKALLPVHGKPVIAHIVEYFPEHIEIVLGLGYKGEQIQTFLEHAYPNRTFTFCQVENFDGPGSGPGTSLLACKQALDCPFILGTVDTMVYGEIPEPGQNWLGVAKVEDTTRFCSVKTDENNNVIRIDDKVKTDNKYAWIGLAAVHDYEEFWKALETNNTLIAGEKQFSNGFQRLRELGSTIQVFDWYDTGTVATYEQTRKTYPKQTVLTQKQ